MTFPAGIENQEMVDDIIAVVEVFVEELLDEFETDEEKVGALGASASMCLSLLCQVKGERRVVEWLNTLVQTWGATDGAIH